MARQTDLETEGRVAETSASRAGAARISVAEESIRESNGEGGPSFRQSSRAKWMILALGLVLAAVAALLWRHYAGWESTDDAQIEGHIDPISARVGGHVSSVKVHENEYVEAGAVLVELDPKDYQVALDRAKADYANALASAEAARAGVPIASVSTTSQVTTSEAAVENARAALAADEKQVQAAEARVEEAQANHAKAQADLNRYQQLVGKQEISAQQYDQAIATAKASEASVAASHAQAQAAAQQVTEARGKLAQTEAELRSARTAPQQVSMTRARATAAAAAAEMARAALEQAELNLRYDTIVAPVSGLVGKKSVEVGQNVMAGQALMALVPLDDIWVTANFKETQLTNMRPGQRVKIHVDAYDRDYDGYVESLAAATGADFSLLPPENATGNYVKVVQRVPVRIRFGKGQDAERLLRLGMSVEPKVKID